MIFFKRNPRLRLRNRVVLLSDDVIKEHDIASYGSFCGDKVFKNGKLVEADIQCYPSQACIDKKNKEKSDIYDAEMKEYEANMASWKKATAAWPQVKPAEFDADELRQAYARAGRYISSIGTVSGQAYGTATSNAYEYQQHQTQQRSSYMYPQSPRHPYKNKWVIDADNWIFPVKRRDIVKLLPKQYLLVDGILTKSLERSGVKRTKKHMPRIFKYLLLLALVIFVFSVVTTLDSNMGTIIHMFLK